MSGPAGFAADQLRSFVERLERIEDRVRAKQGAQRVQLLQIGAALWPDGFKGKDGRKLPNPMARYLAQIQPTPDGCWEWTGPMSNSGYGLFSFAGRYHLAHRWIVEVIKGPIADGLVIDHLCRNQKCAHLLHLEVVTQAENVRRGRSPEVSRQRQSSKTHCPQGHSYAGANLYVLPNNGGRACRICADARRLAFKERKRDA